MCPPVPSPETKSLSSRSLRTPKWRTMLAILTTTATAFTAGAPARGVSGRVQRHAAVTSLDFLKQCETSLRCALRLRFARTFFSH